MYICFIKKNPLFYLNFLFPLIKKVERLSLKMVFFYFKDEQIYYLRVYLK